MSEGIRAFLKRSGPLVGVVRTGRKASAQLTRARHRFTDPRRVRSYLGSDVRKLQLGAGPNALPGWLNTDIEPQGAGAIYLDATRPFPLPDATFDYVFSEHQIEHIEARHAFPMLRETFRVLKPGGRLRIATPDLAVVVALYEEGPEVSERYLEYVIALARSVADSGRGRAAIDVLTATPAGRRAFVINEVVRWYGHQFIYDEATLTGLLESAGFSGVARHAVGESEDEALRDLESHAEAAGDPEMNRFETLVLEATRPG
jgi:SAM-dependent methyltransferase